MFEGFGVSNIGIEDFSAPHLESFVFVDEFVRFNDFVMFVSLLVCQI